ncbi:hypothetical protein ON010_g18039 [Phytophthora cinnamomi]|nr:hypothetical protein ON010_g18039 [Phytophthora cinnamomi]
MRYRQKLYAALKKEGQQIEWKTASISKLEDSLAQYKGNQKKMKTIYNFTSKAQQERTDARNVRQISSLPIGERLTLPIHHFNRTLNQLSAGEDRSLLVSLKDHYGSITKTTVLRNRNFVGDNLFASIASESGSDPDFQISDNIIISDVDLQWIRPPKYHRKRSEFFRYFTKTNFDLEEFQVFQSINKSNQTSSEVPCFLFGLKQSGVSDEKLSQITATMFSYAATHDFIRKTAIDYGLHIKLLTYKAYENRFDFNRTSYGDKSLPMIEMACVGQHIFAIKPTKVSLAAIKYPEFANHESFPSIHVRNGRIAKGSSPKLLMSHQVIGHLYFNRDTLLTPITLQNAPELHNNKYGEIDYLDESAITSNWFREIGMSETFGSPPFTKKVDDQIIAEKFQTVYFDLETFSDSKANIAARVAKASEGHNDGNHIAYCSAWKIDNGPTQHAYGFNCVKTMLDSLPNNGKFLMWAHNAGFDSRFLIRHFSSFGARMGVIESGNFNEVLGRHV